MLKAMANSHRLLILCELHRGERSVSGLEAVVPLSQSALSQHLAKLRECGIVSTRREVTVDLLLFGRSSRRQPDRNAVRTILRATEIQIQKEQKMTIDRAVMAFAGTMILLSLALAYAFTPYWLALAAFVGLNLLQSSFTGFCPLAMVLKRLGVRQGAAF